MFPPNHPKEDAGDRSDSSNEWQSVREEVPVVDRKWTRPLGYLYEPWNWDGIEPDGVGEEDQRGRDQVATLTTRTFHW